MLFHDIVTLAPVHTASSANDRYTLTNSDSPQDCTGRINSRHSDSS